MESLHIYPWEIFALIVFGAILYYFKRDRTPKGSAAAPAKRAMPGIPGLKKAAPAAAESPEEVYTNLRQQALETVAENLALPAGPKVEPFGVLMEMGIPKSVVTLVCFADGNASLYYKTGGGMVGGVSHENVRKAAQEFTALARKTLPRMKRATTYPLPEPDRVRFYALTSRGIFTIETYREDLGETQSDLSALFYSGQEVVTQMRQAQEQRSSERQISHPAPPPDPDPEPDTAS
ncbi:MAG TPA: hypothetical protein VGH73_16480 [Thermoanaerobaculia bacterium]|jgi:hypothetical protein